MDFIRKNWSRLSLAFLYLIGGVIAVIAWVNYANTYSSVLSNLDWLTHFQNIALLVSTIAFFFGMVAITVVKSLQNSKKAVSAIYMVVGGIATLALLVYIIVATCQDADLVVFTGANALNRFYVLWVPFFVFGLHPLIKGITRFIEASAVPAKAAATPVVAAEQPAVETPVAEAPKKATARKSTKAAK